MFHKSIHIIFQIISKMSLVPSISASISPVGARGSSSLTCCICKTSKTDLQQIGAIPNVCGSCKEVARQWTGHGPLPSPPIVSTSVSVSSPVNISVGGAFTRGHSSIRPLTSLSDFELCAKLCESDDSNSGHRPSSYVRNCVSLHYIYIFFKVL